MVAKVLIFVSFVYASPLYSMEIELESLHDNSQSVTYISIAENALTSIDNQRIRLPKNITIPELKLNEIHGHFKSLSDDKNVK
jgi:hypothetical protein